MSNCRRFQPKEDGVRLICANCKRWNGKKCKDEVDLTTNYEDSKEFETYERLMRENKGVFFKN
ncbi:MAG: hypothetical protein P4L59_16375 [Desulfosporosinus sp.]|nr:hypothetical protein [Desulfosporosinus sp.]